MSDQQDVNGGTFFHLSYVSSSFHSPSATKRSTFRHSPLQIIQVKSLQITRCRKDIHSDIFEQCCFSQNKYCEKLALLVSPTLTSEFISAVNSQGGPQSNFDQGIIAAELDFRKSIHPCLCVDHNGSNHTIEDTSNIPQMSIYAIITSDKDSTLPADVVLFQLDKRKSGDMTAGDPHHFAKDILGYSSLLNHETASRAPWSVMKAFPVCSVSSHDVSTKQIMSGTEESKESDKKSIENPTLPCCPVCLHLIDPTTLGLPGLKNHHKCSPWCLNFNNSLDDTVQYTCTNEMKLEPWPPPAKCNACNVIRQRDSMLGAESITSLAHNSVPSPDCLKCHECGMTTTLWVCLTCGVVGCGRYTLKHAADHFTSTRHPYSLELATMRIWDYENGSFVHRRDLLECPVMTTKWGNTAGTADAMQFTSPLIASSRSADMLESPDHHYLKNNDEGIASPTQNGLSPLNHPQPSCRDNLRQNLVPDKLSHPPKKSMMVSEEYEALLQSALEDQAMHFEGEISHLRAELASSRMKHSGSISERDTCEINSLRKDSERLKCEVENLSTALLEIQTEESQCKAWSQKLLREQSISKELLERLRNEIRSEHDSCRQRMDDLELQIEDLIANLRMRTQIAQSEELNQAQIVGTVGGTKDTSNSKKKGKKSLRFGRKK
jgi:hypothetical protein